MFSEMLQSFCYFNWFKRIDYLNFISIAVLNFSEETLSICILYNSFKFRWHRNLKSFLKLVYTGMTGSALWLLGGGGGGGGGGRGHFKNAYELLNLRALKISPANKMHIFQWMGKIFCVEFQRVPLKFHTKYLTHTMKDAIFIQHWNFKSS